jgi:multidrug efflux pump subunit AcrA (membrane-fusion protein)
VNLRVTITAAATDGEVLVVPLAAVSSAADGSTRVSILGSANGSPVEVAVTAGLSADGFVAIEPVEPGSLAAGDLVVVGR